MLICTVALHDCYVVAAHSHCSRSRCTVLLSGLYKAQYCTICK